MRATLAHGPEGTVPVVAMTTREAERLAAILLLAQDRITGELRRLRTVPGMREHVQLVEAQLDTFDAFCEAHRRAHGLGGT